MSYIKLDINLFNEIKKKYRRLGNMFCTLISNNNTVIANSNFRKSLYYSEDNGKTWNWSNID